MNHMLRTFVLGFVFAFSTLGCQAAVGTSGSVTVPKDAASTCAHHCSSVGLPLDSVVIMANNVGCVCRAAPASSTPAASPVSENGGSTAGGMAALIVAEQQRKQQQGYKSAGH